jgi:inhibitor of KinA
VLYKEPLIKPSGDRAFRVTFGDERSLSVHRPVRAMCLLLERKSLKGITEKVPTYASVTVMYDPSVVGPSDLFKQLRDLSEVAASEAEVKSKARLLRIPVCYESEYAPDMEYICRYCALSREDVVRIHTAESYYVFQLGFTPGCPFIGPLQKALHVPLMESPRTSTPKGAVAISVGQTVIYPRATPGGMRLVGRTPVQLFQLDHPALTLFKPGDRVQFYAIAAREFRSMEQQLTGLMSGVQVEDDAD